MQDNCFFYMMRSCPVYKAEIINLKTQYHV